MHKEENKNNMQINLKINQLWWLCLQLQMCSLQGKTLADVQNKLKTSYWPAMKMNWKLWTPVQFININYVPVQVGVRSSHQSSPDFIRLVWSIISLFFLLLFAQFRVLFANMVALFWYAYLSSVRKWNHKTSYSRPWLNPICAFKGPLRIRYVLNVFQENWWGILVRFCKITVMWVSYDIFLLLPLTVNELLLCYEWF